MTDHDRHRRRAERRRRRAEFPEFPTPGAWFLAGVLVGILGALLLT